MFFLGSAKICAGDGTRAGFTVWRGRRVRPFLRGVALAVAVIFLFEQTGVAQNIKTAPTVASSAASTHLNLNQFSIPRDIAITKDVKKTDSLETIINIKDVHNNYGAQESIVEVLDNLLTNYDVRFVGVEGSEGYIDTSVISAFPDERVKKLSADYMMRQGKISAGEFFASVSRVPILLYGIDDSLLYVKNYYAFLNLLEYKKLNLKLVTDLKTVLSALEEHVFSEDLKVLNSNSVLNAEEKRFTKRWGTVREMGKKYGVELSAYPNVTALTEAARLEGIINYQMVNSERDELLDIMAERLKKAPLEELVLKSLAFKLEKISKSQFYSYLVTLAKAEGIERSRYEHLESFCEYVTIYESIDIAGLMDEIDDYEERIREKLFRTNEERELVALLKNVNILRNLYSIRLTSGQLKYLRKNIKNFKNGIFLDFIKISYEKYGMPIPAELAESMEIFSRLPEAITFYETATARNAKMVENTIREMRKTNVDVAAVVTGGFHSRGITDILKADNVSYLVLLPRFNAKTGQRPYVSVLTNKANEYKEYVDSGEYLAVTSMHPELMNILLGIGMEDVSFIEKQSALGNLLGTYFYLREKDGYRIDARATEKITMRLLPLILQKQVEALKARGEDVTQETINHIKSSENYKFLERVLDSAIITSDKKNNRVDVCLESNEVGRCLYSVKVEKDASEKENVNLKISNNVPEKVFEEKRFIQSMQSARIAADKAITEGKKLFEELRPRLMSELRKKAEGYLEDKIKMYGNRINWDKALSEKEITALLGRLGGQKDDVIIKDFMANVRPLMIGQARKKAAEEKIPSKKVLPKLLDALTARVVYAMKRIGLDTDTGQKARDFIDNNKAIWEVSARTVTAVVKDGMSVKVIEADLGNIAPSFQFRLNDDTVVLVMNNNSAFREAVEKIFKKTTFSYSDVLEEAEYHELREAYWINEGLTSSEAHIAASAETIKKFGRAELNGLTPYHYTELLSLSQSALQSLLDEDRSSHKKALHKAIAQGANITLVQTHDYEANLRKNAKALLRQKTAAIRRTEKIGPVTYLEGVPFSHKELNEMVEREIYSEIHMILESIGKTDEDLKNEQVLRNDETYNIFELYSQYGEILGENGIRLIEGENGKIIAIVKGIVSHSGRESGQVWINSDDLVLKKEELRERLSQDTDLIDEAKLESLAIDALTHHLETERDELLDRVKKECNLLGVTAKEIIAAIDTLSNNKAKEVRKDAHNAAVAAEEEFIQTRIEAQKRAAKLAGSRTADLKENLKSRGTRAPDDVVEQFDRNIRNYNKIFSKIKRWWQKTINRSEVVLWAKKIFAKTAEKKEKHRKNITQKVSEEIDVMETTAEIMSTGNNSIHTTVIDEMKKEVDKTIRQKEKKIRTIQHALTTKLQRVMKLKKDNNLGTTCEEGYKTNMETELAELKKELEIWEEIQRDRKKIALLALIRQNDAVLRKMVKQNEFDTQEFRILSAANVSLTMKLRKGMVLREHQIEAVEYTIKGFILNLETGQGKTFVALYDRYLASLKWEGNPVDIMAKEDKESKKLAYELGMQFNMLGLGYDFLSAEQNMDYDGRILDFYKANGELDKTAKEKELLKRRRKASLANIRFVSHHIVFALLHDVRIGRKKNNEHYLLKGFYDILIDESDSLVLDQALSEFIIAVREGRLSPHLALPFYIACSMASLLQKNTERTMLKTTYDEKLDEIKSKDEEIEEVPGVWVILNEETNKPTLTKEGKGVVDDIVGKAESEILEKMGVKYTTSTRPDWKKLVQDSLDVRFREGQAYWGINPETGKREARLLAEGLDAQDRKWQDGQDEAIQILMGNYEISGPGKTQSKMSMKELLDMVYEGRWTGLSGTNIEAQDEYSENYGGKQVASAASFEKGSLKHKKDVIVLKGQKFKQTILEFCRLRQDEYLSGIPIVLMRGEYHRHTKFVEQVELILLLAKKKINVDDEITPTEWLDADGIQEVKNTFRALTRGDKKTLEEQEEEKFQTVSADNEAEKKNVEAAAGRLGYLSIIPSDMGSRASDYGVKGVCGIYKDALKAFKHMFGNDHIKKAICTVLNKKTKDNIGGIDKFGKDYNSAREILKQAGILERIESIQEIIAELSDVSNENNLRDNAGDNFARKNQENRLKNTDPNEGLFAALIKNFQDEKNSDMASFMKDLSQKIILRYDANYGIQFIKEKDKNERVAVQSDGRAARVGMPGGVINIGEASGDETTTDTQMVSDAFNTRDTFRWYSIGDWIFKLKYKWRLEKLEKLEKARTRAIRERNYKEADILTDMIKSLEKKLADNVSHRGTLSYFGEINRRLQDIGEGKADSEETAQKEILEKEWNIYLTAAQKRNERRHVKTRKFRNLRNTLPYQSNFFHLSREISDDKTLRVRITKLIVKFHIKKIVKGAFPKSMKVYRMNPEERKNAYLELQWRLHAVYGETLDLDYLNALIEKEVFSKRRPSKKDIEKVLANIFVRGVEEGKVLSEEADITKILSGVIENFLEEERRVLTSSVFLWKRKMWWRSLRQYGNGWFFAKKRVAKNAAGIDVERQLKKYDQALAAQKVEDKVSKINAERKKKREKEKKEEEEETELTSQELAIQAQKSVEKNILEMTEIPKMGHDQASRREQAPQPTQAYQKDKKLRVRRESVFGPVASREKQIQEAPATATALEKEEEDTRRVDPSFARELKANGEMGEQEQEQKHVTSEIEENTAKLESEKQKREKDFAEKKDASKNGTTSQGGVQFSVLPNEKTAGPGLFARTLSASAPPSGTPPKDHIIFCGKAGAYFESRRKEEKDSLRKEAAKILNNVPTSPDSYRVLLIEDASQVKSLSESGEEVKFYTKSGVMVLSKNTANLMALAWKEAEEEALYDPVSFEKKVSDILLKSKAGFVNAFGTNFFCQSAKEEKQDDGSITSWGVYEVSDENMPDEGYERFITALSLISKEGTKAFRDHEKNTKLLVKPDVPDVLLRTPKWRYFKRKREKEKMQKMFESGQKRPDMDIILKNPFFRSLIYSKEDMPIKFREDGSVLIGNRELTKDNFRYETTLSFPEKDFFERSLPRIEERFQRWLAEIHLFWGITIGIPFFILKGIFYDLPKYLWTHVVTKGIQRWLIEKPKTNDELIEKYYDPTRLVIPAEAGIPSTIAKKLDIVFTQQEEEEIDLNALALADIILKKTMRSASPSRRERLLEEARRIAMYEYVKTKSVSSATTLVKILLEMDNYEDVIHYGKEIVRSVDTENPYGRMMTLSPKSYQDILAALYSAYTQKGNMWKRTSIRDKMDERTLEKAVFKSIRTAKKPEEKEKPDKGIKARYEKSFLIKPVVDFYKKQNFVTKSLITSPLYILFWVFGLKVVLIPAAVVIAAIFVLDVFVAPVIVKWYKKNADARDKKRLVSESAKDAKTRIRLIELFSDSPESFDTKYAKKLLNKLNASRALTGRFWFLRELFFLRPNFFYSETRLNDTLALAEYYLTRSSDTEKGREKAEKLLEFAQKHFNVYANEQYVLLKALLELKKGKKNILIHGRSVPEITKKIDVVGNSHLEILFLLGIVLKNTAAEDRDDDKLKKVIYEIRDRKNRLLPEEGAITDGDKKLLDSRDDMLGLDAVPGVPAYPELYQEEYINLSQMLSRLLKEDTDEAQKNTEKTATDAYQNNKKLRKETLDEIEVTTRDEEKERELEKQEKPEEKELKTRVKKYRRELKNIEGDIEKKKIEERLIGDYILLANLYAEKHEKASFWKKLWRKVTFRSFKTKQIRALKNAIRISMEVTDGELQFPAEMKLLEINIGKWHFKKVSWLISNIRTLLPLVTSLQVKEDNETISENEKETLSLALANLHKMTKLLLETRKARDLYHKRAAAIRTLVETELITLKNAETLKTLIASKLNKDLSLQKGPWRRKWEIRIELWQIERKLLGFETDLERKQDQRGEILKLKIEMSRLNDEILEKYFQNLKLRAESVNSIDSNPELLWNFVLNELKPDIDAYMQRELETERIYNTSHNTFRHEIETNLGSTIPPNLKYAILNLFVLAWMKANQRQFNDTQLINLNEKKDEIDNEKPSSAIKSGTVKYTQNEKDIINKVDLEEKRKLNLAGFISAFTANINLLSDPRLSFEYKAWIGQQLFDVMKQAIQDNEINGIEGVLTSALNIPLVLKLKQQLFKRLYIDPARKTMHKDKKDKIDSVTPSIRQYVNGLLFLIEKSEDAEVISNAQNDFFDIMPRLPTDEKEEFTKAMLALITPDNFESFSYAISQLLKINDSFEMKKDILIAIFNIAKQSDDIKIFEKAKSFASAYFKTDFEGETDSFRELIIYLLRTYPAFDYTKPLSVSRFISVFVFLREEIRSGENFKNLKIIANVLSGINVSNELIATEQMPEISLTERDKYLSALHNLYFAVNKAQKKAKQMPRLSLAPIKTALLHVRQEIEDESRQKIWDILSNAADAFYTEADSKYTGGDNDGAVSNATKAIEKFKRIIEEGRKSGHITDRGDGLFTKYVNDQILRSYLLTIRCLFLQGKTSEAMKKQHEMHLWAHANINTLQNDPGDELRAAEEVLDRTKRIEPESAKVSKERADMRVSFYRDANKTIDETRKQREKDFKKETELEETIDETKKQRDDLKLMVDEKKKGVVDIEKQLKSLRSRKNILPLGRYLSLRKARFFELRDANKELLKQKKLLQETEDKLKGAEDEKKKITEQLNADKKEFVELERIESFARERAEEEINFGETQDNSFQRSMDDYILALSQATDKENDIAVEIEKELLFLAEDTIRARYILNEISRILDSLEDDEKDVKKRALKEKRFKIAGIKICENLLKSEDTTGREALLLSFPRTRESITTISIDSVTTFQIDTLTLFEYLTEEDDSLSLQLLLEISKNWSDTLIGTLALRKLINRIYRAQNIADENVFPEIDTTLDAFAREEAIAAVSFREKKKKDEKAEKEKPLTPLQKAMEIEDEKETTETQLGSLPALIQMLTSIQNKHDTDKPWEKMTEKEQKNLVIDEVNPFTSASLKLEDAIMANPAEKVRQNANEKFVTSEYAEAEKLYDEAKDAGIDDAKIHYYRGRIYESQKLFTKAMEEYEKVLEKGEETDEIETDDAYTRLVALYQLFNKFSELRKVHATRAAGLLKISETPGMSDLEKNDTLDKALDTVNESLKIIPLHAESMLLKAKILNALGRNNEALILVNEILYRTDMNRIKRFFLEILNPMKKWRVFKASSAEKEAHLLRARVYEAAGEKKRKVNKEANRAIKLGEQSSEVYFIKAKTETPRLKGIVFLKWFAVISGFVLIPLGAAIGVMYLLSQIYSFPVIFVLKSGYTRTFIGIVIPAIIVPALAEIWSWRRKTPLYERQKEYLQKAVSADSKNYSAKDQLYKLLEKMEDYDAIISECKKEEETLKKDRTQKTRVRELKKRRALALLDKQKQRFSLTRAWKQNEKALTLLNDDIKEAKKIDEMLVTDGSSPTETQTEFEFLKQRALKLISWRIFLRKALDKILFVFRIYRTANKQALYKYLLLSAQFSGDNSESDAILNRLWNAPDIIASTREEVGKELSENLRLRAQMEIDTDWIRFLLAWSLYYDSRNAKARLARGCAMPPGTFAEKEITKAFRDDPSLGETKEGRAAYKILADCYLEDGNFDAWLDAKHKSLEKRQIDASLSSETQTNAVLDKQARDFIDNDKPWDNWIETKKEVEELNRNLEKHFQHGKGSEEQSDVYKAFKERLDAIKFVSPFAESNLNTNSVELMRRIIYLARSNRREREILIEMLASTTHPAIKARIHFALAEAYEKSGKTDKAWEQINALTETLRDRLPEYEQSQVLLIEASLYSKAETGNDILKGFGSLNELKILNDEISTAWLETLTQLIAAYRAWQKKEEKETGRKTDDALLMSNIDMVITAMPNPWIRMLSDKIATNLLNAEMPVLTPEILGVLNRVPDADRIKLLAGIVERLKLALIRGEGVNIGAYENLFKRWKASGKEFKPICNQGLGLISIENKNFFSAKWWYFGRKAFLDANLAAYVAFLKAEEYEPENYGKWRRWWFRNRAIKRYQLSLTLPPSFSSTSDPLSFPRTRESINKKLSELYIDSFQMRWFTRKKQQKVLIQLGRIEKLLNILEDEKTEGKTIENSLLSKIQENLDRSEKTLKNIYRGGLIKRFWRFIRDKKTPGIPDDIQIRLLSARGNLYLLNDSTNQAEAAFKRIMDLNEKNVQAIIGLRDSALQKGESEDMDALRYQEEARELQLSLAEEKSVAMSKVYIRFAENEQDVVTRLPVSQKLIILTPLALYERALALDSDNQELKIMLADEYFDMGMTDRALDTISPLVKDKKKVDETKELTERIKGRISEKRDEVTGRFSVEGGVERYVFIAQQIVESETLIEQLQKKQIEVASMNKPEIAVSDVLSFLPEGKQQAILKELNKIKLRESLRTKLGAILHDRIEEIKKVKTLYEQKLSTIDISGFKPVVVKRLLSLAEQMLHSGQASKALKIAKKAVPLDPGNAELKIVKAECYIRLKRFYLAKNLYANLFNEQDRNVVVKACSGLIKIEDDLTRQKIYDIRSNKKMLDTTKKDKILTLQKNRDNEILELYSNLINKFRSTPFTIRQKAELNAQLMQIFGKAIQILRTRKNLAQIIENVYTIAMVLQLAGIDDEINLPENTDEINFLLNELNGTLRDEELVTQLDIGTFSGTVGNILSQVALHAKNDATLNSLVDFFFITNGDFPEILENILTHSKESQNKEQRMRLMTKFNDYLFKTDNPPLLSSFKEFYTTTSEMFIEEEEIPENIKQAIATGFGLINFRSGEYAKAVGYFKQAGARPQTRYYFVLSRIKAGGSINRMMAYWTVFAMWRQAPYSMFTSNARSELGLKPKDGTPSKFWEIIISGWKPLLWSPFAEGVRFAAAPAVTAMLFSRIGGLSLLPQGLMIMATVMLAGMIFTFKHKTGEHTAAIVTGLNIVILPFAIHLNLVWYAVFALITAYLIHASINLFAFIINTIAGRIVIPYAQIEPKKKPPQAIVEIDKKAEDMLRQLSEVYPDIQFITSDIPTPAKTPLRAQVEIPQFLIDMSQQDLENNINDIVKYVRRAAFIQKYPYKAGLDSVAVRQMNIEKLRDTLITLKMILSLETEMDNRIDMILTRNFTPSVLKKQENVAMEGKVENELIKNLPVLKANGLIPEKQAVVYDLRDVPADVFAEMLPALKRMAKADKNVYACLIDPENRFKEMVNENIFYLTSVSSKTPIIDQARDFLLAKLEIDDFPLASISVVTTESKSGDYMKHIETAGIEKANFVIAGKNIMNQKDSETEHIQNMLPAMALMGIVKRYLSKDKRANIIAVDCSSSILTKIKRIKDIILTAITRLNINDEITNEISAIIQTAQSV